MSESAAVYPQSTRRRLRIDDRYIAPIFITFILLVGQYYYHILESYQNTALAIITSISMELILGKMFTGKWPHWASAYISGISVGILVRSPFVWPFALCSAIAITSKYGNIHMRTHRQMGWHREPDLKAFFREVFGDAR